jgi:hypothetical protein
VRAARASEYLVSFTVLKTNNTLHWMMRQETSIMSPSTAIASSSLLDRWATHDWRDGLRIPDLSPLDRVIVRTQNSTYELVVTTPELAHVVVRGGAFFPAFAAARVAGSSLGGSFLKLHSIHVGFRMELISESQSLVTSTVQTISIADHQLDDVM